MAALNSLQSLIQVGLFKRSIGSLLAEYSNRRVSILSSFIPLFGFLSTKPKSAFLISLMILKLMISVLKIRMPLKC